jgi:predicted metal-dependent HD superfamily phosphohydrolase
MLSDPAVMRSLRMRYAEPHRRYHGWSHIEELHRIRDWALPILFNQQAIDLAILFHDCVHEPGEQGNERRSADLMVAMLGKDIAPVTLEAAKRLILATADHLLPPDLVDPVRADCAAFLDMDFAVFGSAREVYAAFEAAIQEEHSEVAPEEYRAGRRQMLIHFAGRDQLFFTPLFRQEFEAQARRNLDAAIRALTEA